MSDQELLRLIGEGARVGLAVLNADRRYVYTNRTYSEILGLPTTSLVGRRVADLLPDVYEQQIRSRLDRGFAGERLGYELRKSLESGDHYFAVSYQPALTDGMVTGVVVVITDVTARKTSEADAGRVAAIVESSDDAIIGKDLDGNVTSWNPAAERLFGYSAEEMIGTSITRIIPEDRRDEETAILASIRRGDRVDHFETVRRRKDGETIEVSITASPIKDADGRVVGASKVSRDITARRSLEAQYHQAQKMEAIGRLAGGVAHDFNNLLTAILGYSQLLYDNLGTNDPRRADVEEILKAGESAAGLTRQLLAFSRKQIVAPTVLNLNDVVEKMRGLLARVIGDDVHVVFNLRPGIARITADPGQVEQIVLNLAVNARDAMPHGGTLTIETAGVELDAHYAASHHAVEPGAYVTLTVSDTGVGMSPEVQSRLFEPFFTTKPPGKGTGLGLATVHGIVTGSGGRIGVYSEPGDGTSVVVYLPQSPSSDVPVSETAPDVRRTRTGERVMVVDDSTSIRELTRRMLELDGYEVVAAANAAEAMQVFAASPPVDVLVTDVVMPDGSGPELAARLKALHPGLKVIYMSGYTEDTITHHGVVDPGIAFLQKPFSSASLERKLREVLDT